MDQVKPIRCEEGECIISYDVKALFTSVPMNPAISIVKHRLGLDIQLHHKRSMSIHHITMQLEFCFKIPISSSEVGIINL